MVGAFRPPAQAAASKRFRRLIRDIIPELRHRQQGLALLSPGFQWVSLPLRQVVPPTACPQAMATPLPSLWAPKNTELQQNS